MLLKCIVETSEVKIKCASKLKEICVAKGQYVKNLLELEKLQKASASQPKKAAHPASAGGGQGVCSAWVVGEELAEGAKEFAAAFAELEQLDQRLERERELCRQVAWRLGAEKRALRDSAVTPAELDKWSSVRLVCSSKTIRDNAALAVFLASLAEAPCLEALDLCLGNEAHTLPALQRVLDALPSAPARIKEIVLTFGHSSLEDVIALLGHVEGHLEKLSVAAPFQHAVYDTQDALQRFWTAVEATGVTSLDLAGPCLKLQYAAEIQLQPAKWRLETLKACVSAHGQRTLLPALIRANAPSLREAQAMALSMTPDDSAAAFSALAECAKLVEVTVPCCKDVALLERCASLTKISVVGASLMLEGGDRVRKAVEAVAKLLAQPAVVERVDSLAVSFMFGLMGREKVFKAVRGMAKLKSLSVTFCAGFDAELKDTLKSLPLLEELQLDGDPWCPPRALDDIAPANAPSLQTLRLGAGLLGGSRDAPRSIAQRFAAAGRRLQVQVEQEDRLSSDSAGDDDMPLEASTSDDDMWADESPSDD